MIEMPWRALQCTSFKWTQPFAIYTLLLCKFHTHKIFETCSEWWTVVECLLCMSSNFETVNQFFNYCRTIYQRRTWFSMNIFHPEIVVWTPLPLPKPQLFTFHCIFGRFLVELDKESVSVIFENGYTHFKSTPISFGTLQHKRKASSAMPIDCIATQSNGTNEQREYHTWTFI